MEVFCNSNLKLIFFIYLFFAKFLCLNSPDPWRRHIQSLYSLSPLTASPKLSHPLTATDSSSHSLLSYNSTISFLFLRHWCLEFRFTLIPSSQGFDFVSVIYISFGRETFVVFSLASSSSREYQVRTYDMHLNPDKCFSFPGSAVANSLTWSSTREDQVRAHDIHLNPDKCFSRVGSGKFLGFIIIQRTKSEHMICISIQINPFPELAVANSLASSSSKQEWRPTRMKPDGVWEVQAIWMRCKVPMESSPHCLDLSPSSSCKSSKIIL